MRVSDELLLMLFALALYLGDSALFLASNEAVLQSRGGRWTARFGLDRWRLAGREPYLPNPFTPYRPLVRLRWRFDGARSDAAAPIGPAAEQLAVPPELANFRLHVLVSFACLFVLMPLALFWPQGMAFLIGTVAVFYVNVGVAMLRLHRMRAAFALPPGAFGVLAFECLACPPFSVNLVRKLSARLPAGEDFIAAAARLLPEPDLAAARAQCLRRVDEQIDYAEEGSERMSALLASRERLGTGGPP